MAILNDNNASFHSNIKKDNMNPQDKEKPFDMGYVLRTTAKHMRKNIEVSIRKTFARIPEFADDQEKSFEIFKTLSVLHQMRAQLDEFQKSNATSFRTI